jgi:hypothetical protein
MSRSPTGAPRKIGAFQVVADPHPKGLRKNTGRTALPAARLTIALAAHLGHALASKAATNSKALSPFAPRETCAGPCEPSRYPKDLGTTQAGHFIPD